MSSNAIKTRMGFTEWAMLMGLAFLWGISYFVITIALEDLPPLTLAILRVGLAALVLWTVVLVTRDPIPWSLDIWFAFLVMGLLNNVIPFSLIMWGQQSIPGGLSAILNSATPLFTVFVASFFLADENLTRMKVIGGVLGFTGVAVMIGPAALKGMGFNLLAQLAILGASLSYAFSGTYGRRFKRMNISTTVIAMGQVTASTLVLIPIVLVLEKPLSLDMPSTNTWIAVITLAVFCTALAYLLYFRILSSSGAVNLSLVTLLIPVTAVLLGAVFLGERLGWEHLFGIVLVAIGLSVIDGRLWDRKKLT